MKSTDNKEIVFNYKNKFDMKNKSSITRKARYFLYTLLAVVLYIVWIPMTILQASAFILQYFVTSEWLFDKYLPLSGEVAKRVMSHYR